MLAEFKKIGIQTIIYGSGMMLGKAIGFFLIPLYTHFLTPKDYGILELLDLTGYMIGYIIGFGLDSALLRYYSFYEDDNDKEAVISTAFLFQAIIWLAAIFVLYNLRNILSTSILGSSAYTTLFVILFLNLFLQSLNGLLKVSLRAKQKSTEFVIVSLICTAIALTLNIVFVAFLKLGVKGILYSGAITSFISLVYLTIRMVFRKSFSFHPGKLKQMLKYGIPLVPGGIFAFILNWSDRYILRIYYDMETIGLYSLGYKVGMIVSFLIAGPFQLVWSVYMFDVGKKENAKEIYSRVTTYFILLSCAVGLAIAVFSKEIIIIMADPSYLDAYKIIPLIALSMILMTTDNVFQTGLLLERKTVYLPIGVGTAAVVNITLNFLLVPKYGMMGAALATALSYCLYSMGILYFAQKMYYIPFEFERLIKIAFIVMVIFGASSMVTIENVWLAVIVKSFILSTFSLLLYVSGFFVEKEKAFIAVRLKTFYQKAFMNSRRRS